MAETTCVRVAAPLSKDQKIHLETFLVHARRTYQCASINFAISSIRVVNKLSFLEFNPIFLAPHAKKKTLCSSVAVIRKCPTSFLSIQTWHQNRLINMLDSVDKNTIIWFVVFFLPPPSNTSSCCDFPKFLFKWSSA